MVHYAAVAELANPVRLPLGVTLESRDGTLAKDALVRNAFVETQGNPPTKVFARLRPGLSKTGLIRSGIAQMLAYWAGQPTSVIGDVLSIGLVSSYTNVTTWNPSDKSANVTLSNGNLTARCVTSGNVRSIAQVQTAWLWQGKITAGVTSFGAYLLCFGLQDGAAALTSPIGTTANSVGYNANGTISKNNVVQTSGAPVLVLNDVFSVLWNPAASTVSFYVNGTLAYTVTGVTMPTGGWYAAVGSQNNVSADTTVLCNFGATAFTYTPGVVTTNLSPTTASLPFSAQDNGANAPNPQLMIKNASQAWTVSAAGVPTLITDVDYPGTYTVTLTSLTRSGTTATATTPSNTNFQVGSTVTIAGATPSAYNGAQVITAVTPSTNLVGAGIAIGITRSGTTATATTLTQPHGFINGQVVPISGATQPEYNGNFTITWISATQFSFTVTVTGTDQTTATYAQVTSPATGAPIIAGNVITLPQVNNNAGTDRTAFVATLANPVTYAPINGQTVTFSGIGNGFDGSYTVAGATATGFTFTVAGFTSFLSFSGQASIVAPTITSLTAVATVATATTGAAHNFLSGRSVTISGATQPQYNGTFIITVIGATTFTYPVPLVASSLTTVSSPATPATGTIIAGVPGTVTGASFTFTIAGSPATPATGTITATGGRNTVPGIAYLDGYFNVMDVNGVVYSSDLDNPSSWGALNYQTAQNEPGAGVAIAKNEAYVVAFK